MGLLRSNHTLKVSPPNTVTMATEFQHEFGADKNTNHGSQLPQWMILAATWWRSQLRRECAWWFIFLTWPNVESFRKEAFGHACENIQTEFIEMGKYISTVGTLSGKVGSWTEWRGERELSTPEFASWTSPLKTLSQLWENKPFFSLVFFTLGILLHVKNKAIKESF